MEKEWEVTAMSSLICAVLKEVWDNEKDAAYDNL